MLANVRKSEWISQAPNHAHFCQPKDCSTVDGLTRRRSALAKTAAGSHMAISKAITELEKDVAVKFSNKPAEYQKNVRQVACANRTATAKALNRARKKRYPVVPDYSDLLSDDNMALRMTFRGTIEDGEHYAEKLVLYSDAEMIIFMSPRQQVYFRRTREIVCDGSFKFRPVGSYQVYRVFGFVKETHSVPLITALLKKKDEKLYRKMWKQVARAPELNNKRIRLQLAHFDDEPAAYNSFNRQFPDVVAKMCAFHVKQALNRQVQFKGLSILYANDGNVQKIVRMLGALQLAPVVVWTYWSTISEVTSWDMQQRQKQLPTQKPVKRKAVKRNLF